MGGFFFTVEVKVYVLNHVDSTDYVASYVILHNNFKVTINCTEGCLHSEFIALIFRKP